MAATDAELDNLIASTPPAGGKHSDSDLDALIASTPAASTKTDTAIHHGLQGLTMGFSDELGGLGTAGLQALTNALPKSVADKLDLAQAPAKEAYRSSRDDERALLAKQAKDHPTLSTASEIAGGVAGGLALPVARIGSGAAGLIGSGALTGAGYGALAGAGTSTEDSAAGLAGDALKGGAMGGALGAAGGLVGAGAQKLSQYAGGKVAAGLAKADEMAKAEELKAGQGAIGRLGGESQKGSRIIEYLTDGEAKGMLSPDEQAHLDALRSSGAWDNLVHGVTGGKLDDAPNQLEAIAKARQGVWAQQPANTDAVEMRAKQIASPAEGLRQVGQRLQRYVPRAAGGVLAKLMDGEGSSMAQGQVLGPMMHSIKRAIGAPSVQVPIYRAMGRVGELLSSNPQALGKFGGALTSIAEQHGPEAAAAAHFVLSQSNPEYQKLAQGEGGGD